MNRENGLRPDLVQLLKDMKPGFLRFPGGCIVEGRTLAQRYQWKETIGDVAGAQPVINRWNTEFMHQLTPDYYQSFGLGFLRVLPALGRHWRRAAADSERGHGLPVQLGRAGAHQQQAKGPNAAGAGRRAHAGNLHSGRARSD